MVNGGQRVSLQACWRPILTPPLSANPNLESATPRQERVKAAEESEGGSKSELASLLDAHDQLQGKWRAASKEVQLLCLV